MALQAAYDKAVQAAIALTEAGGLPDALTRAGIRFLLRQRIQEVTQSATLRSGRSPTIRTAAAAAAAAAACQPPRAACPHPLDDQTTATGQEYYARLLAFRDDLCSMPVAVQVGAAAACCTDRPPPAPAPLPPLRPRRLPPSPACRATAHAPAQTAAANEQHYELPTEYFLAALGPHRKARLGGGAARSAGAAPRRPRGLHGPASPAASAPAAALLWS